MAILWPVLWTVFPPSLLTWKVVYQRICRDAPRYLGCRHRAARKEAQIALSGAFFFFVKPEEGISFFLCKRNWLCPFLTFIDLIGHKSVRENESQSSSLSLCFFFLLFSVRSLRFFSFPFPFLHFIYFLSPSIISFSFSYPVSHSVFLSIFPFISPSSPPSVPSFSLILYLLIFLSFRCYCSSLIQFCFTSFPLLSLASPSALSLSYSFLFILHLSLLLLLPSPFHSLLKNRKVDIRPCQLGVPPNHVFLFLLSLSILFYDVLLCVYFSFLI